MITKFSRGMIAFYSGLASFFTLNFMLFSYLYASGKENWIVEVFQIKLFFVPIVFHVLVLSLLIGLLVFITISFFRSRQYGPVEEKLRLLASGNFDSPLLEMAIPHAPENRLIADVDRDIKSIQEKMKQTSMELQQLNARPQFVDGQTKEEILEAERHRLARELHDSVSQQLFAAMMMMSALNEQAIRNDAPDAQKKQLAMVTDIINASQSEMRALLLHLRPVTLEGKTLKQGIEQLLKELETKIKISLKWDIEEFSMLSSIEDQLFRVIQELLSNTLRHAKADELEVYLHRIENNVLLRVIDDGVGFDTENQKAGSYGLMNIRERISAVGGTLKIISFKNQGTSIEIKVPLLKEA
ncbi:sensor histidine kinase [Enterococcus sp.]|uniref:sensor histidine kinase n=1 Tax=Enterococcus sp. TaxID=35783 RepID=UPI0028B1F21C|nr:sensor histidine kinase [Enterococcus sp.]